MSTVMDGSTYDSWYLDPDRHCAQTPQEWWFPPVRASKETTARVAALCVDCPVRGQCADDARACDDRHGIRAGVDLGHVAGPDRLAVLTRIALSRRPGAEPIAVGREGYRTAPARLIHMTKVSGK
ncbi:WhiB family transcriptional regulator [Rhodococcus sp. NPDC058505]|uniref:WhiB family transcriptional regulator n=1 Tax=unclassified Rhodococcus (in: high G+C Gram-positive bacteria) TaxID=192944 RepID=UPI00366054F0